MSKNQKTDVVYLTSSRTKYIQFDGLKEERFPEKGQIAWGFRA